MLIQKMARVKTRSPQGEALVDNLLESMMEGKGFRRNEDPEPVEEHVHPPEPLKEHVDLPEPPKEHVDPVDHAKAETVSLFQRLKERQTRKLLEMDKEKSEAEGSEGEHHPAKRTEDKEDIESLGESSTELPSQETPIDDPPRDISPSTSSAPPTSTADDIEKRLEMEIAQLSSDMESEFEKALADIDAL